MTIQALQMALKESKSQNMHDSSNQLPSQKFTKSTITMSALDVTIVCWPIIYKNNSVRFSCLHQFQENHNNKIYKHEIHEIAADLDDETLNKTTSNNLPAWRECVNGFFFFFTWNLFKSSIFSEAKQSKNQRINHVVITAATAAVANFLLLLLF